MSQRRRQIGRAPAALAWAALLFAAMQLALLTIADGWFPEFEDPEFYVRLHLLQTRMAEQPGLATMVVLGSSRTELGFRPERLPPLATPSGTRVLPFNFSHVGAGPAMNLVALRRLLDCGIRPDWLVVEIMPALLGDRGQNLIIDTASFRDLPTVVRCRSFWPAVGRYAQERLMPCYKHRFDILGRLAPCWLPPDTLPGPKQFVLGPLGDDHLHLEARVNGAERRRRTGFMRDWYRSGLEGMQIEQTSDRALRELLELCGRERVHVLLMLTPEGTDFRSWYPPEVRARIDQYCAALSRAYQVPVIDARTWLRDEDFTDSHHMLLPGAEVFTRRLAEVLQPFVQGQLTADPFIARKEN